MLTTKSSVARVYAARALVTRVCGPRYRGGVAGTAVAVRGVRVAYGSFVVLEDVDLAVAGGEIVAVTGVNGAGK